MPTPFVLKAAKYKAKMRPTVNNNKIVTFLWIKLLRSIRGFITFDR